jgi:hypothetical protein
MQRFSIKRVLPLVTLVLLGSQTGQAIAADRVALLRHETGNEAFRVQHNSSTDSAPKAPEGDTSLFDVQWRDASYALTVFADGKTDITSGRVGTKDFWKNIVRPIRVPTMFSVPVELDLFGVAKRRKSQAILLRTRVKGHGFKLTLSCPW